MQQFSILLNIIIIIILVKSEPNSGIPFFFTPEAIVAHENYSVAQGWLTQGQFPRMLCDIDGDGKKDLVGFFSDGVKVSFSQGNTFEQQINTLASGFDSSNGYFSQNGQPRFCADIDGDKKEDFIGIKGDGVYVSFSNGRQQADPQVKLSNQFGTQNLDAIPIFFGDIDGDGKSDIITIYNTGVYVAFSNGRSNFPPMKHVSPEFSLNLGGWGTLNYEPRYAIDINGDGKYDIAGYAHEGVYFETSQGRGNLQNGYTYLILKYGDNQGFPNFQLQPKFFGDINGDKKGDLIVFSQNQIKYVLGNGINTFQDQGYASTNIMTLGGGWTDFNTYPRMIGDVNGDGLDDVVGCYQQKTFILITKRHCSDLTRDENNSNCECREGYFDNQDNGKCLPCQYPCQTCQSISHCDSCQGNMENRNSPPSCLCKDGYYDNQGQKCEICSHPCKTCEISATSCLTCVFQINRLAIPSACQCMNGYYEDKNQLTCKKCNYRCNKCTEENKCIACSTGYKRSNNPPDCGCEEGFYDDGEMENCKICQEKCKSCINGNYCLECKDSTLIAPYCVPNGQYSISIQGQIILKTCQKKCLTCSANSQCNRCRNYLNRVDNPPYCQCQVGYHDQNGILDECIKCQIGCLKCKSENECQLCDSFLFRQLNEFSGTCDCSRGYFELNQQCKKCYKLNQDCVETCPQYTVQNEQDSECTFIKYDIQNQSELIIISVLQSVSSFSLLPTSREGKFKENLCTKQEIASGFSWAENLILLQDDTIIVSDNNAGIISQLKYDSQSDSYVKSNFSNYKFDKVLGLATDDKIMYAVTQKNSKNYISKFNLQNPNVDWQLDFIELENTFFFNGLALNKKTNTLYTTNENSFLPYKGLLVGIDLNTKQQFSLVEHGGFLKSGQTFSAADGAFINQKDQLLYISEVTSATGTKIDVIDMKSGKRKSIIRPPAISMLDDFCYVEETDSIYGADFWNGTVVRLDNFSKMTTKHGYEGTIIASDLNSPTSVRQSRIHPNTFFITEAGAKNVLHPHSQRVFKLEC